MKKRYLNPGENLSLDFFGRVGPSGTIVDIQADSAKMTEGVNDPNKGLNSGIGYIERNGYTYDVFLEIESGRFWYYDDENWRM